MSLAIWQSHVAVGRRAIPIARAALQALGQPATPTDAALVYNRMDLPRLVEATDLEREVRLQVENEVHRAR